MTKKRDEQISKKIKNEKNLWKWFAFFVVCAIVYIVFLNWSNNDLLSFSRAEGLLSFLILPGIIILPATTLYYSFQAHQRSIINNRLEIDSNSVSKSKIITPLSRTQSNIGIFTSFIAGISILIESFLLFNIFSSDTIDKFDQMDFAAFYVIIGVIFYIVVPLVVIHLICVIFAGVGLAMYKGKKTALLIGLFGNLIPLLLMFGYIFSLNFASN